MIVIYDAKISKQIVTPGETVILKISIGTWNNVKAIYTWDTLKNSGLTWNTLKSRGET